MADSERKGFIYLVGAGPGDPDLLTIAAQKALAKADLVVSDRLISQEILNNVQAGEVRIAKKLPGKSDEGTAVGKSLPLS
jgi:siroheme synthase